MSFPLRYIACVLNISQLHHTPSLFLHPSRRIRLLSGELHSLLLALPGVKSALFTVIRDAEEERQETLIGSWCLLAHDIENQISSTVLPSWEDNFGPKVDPRSEGSLLIQGTAPALISFIRQTIFDPLGAYSVVNPIQPSIDTKPVKKGAKSQPRVQAPPETPSTDEELDAERKARLRAGALGSVKYVLGMLGQLFQPPTSNSPGWSCKEPVSVERFFAGSPRRDHIKLVVVDISLLWRATAHR